VREQEKVRTREDAMSGTEHRRGDRDRRALPAGVCFTFAAGLGVVLWRGVGLDPGWYRIVSALAGLSLIYGISLVGSSRRSGLVPQSSVPATGYRELQEARAAAERRAAELEGTVHGLRGQFKQMFDELKASEARLAVRERETDTAAADLAALREQLRETSGRLRKAELDNNALRQRLAMRSREVEELKAELSQTTEQLHLSKLSEALRDLEGVVR
jgi:predicted RNase H-like nuclease (RuvC/YqgF family)